MVGLRNNFFCIGIDRGMVACQLLLVRCCRSKSLVGACSRIMSNNSGIPKTWLAADMAGQVQQYYLQFSCCREPYDIKQLPELFALGKIGNLSSKIYVDGRYEDVLRDQLCKGIMFICRHFHC